MGWLDGMSKCKCCGRTWAPTASGYCINCQQILSGYITEWNMKEFTEHMKKKGQGVRH